MHMETKPSPDLYFTEEVEKIADSDIQQKNVSNKKNSFNNPHSKVQEMQPAALPTYTASGDMIVSVIEWCDSGSIIHAHFGLSAIIRDGDSGDLFITAEHSECWQGWCTPTISQGFTKTQ